MRPKIREIIDKNLQELVDQIDIDNGLLNRLIQAGVIINNHMESIESKPTGSARIKHLLDILKRQDDDKYPIFCKELGKFQPGLVKQCLTLTSETELPMKTCSPIEDKPTHSGNFEMKSPPAQVESIQGNNRNAVQNSFQPDKGMNETLSFQPKDSTNRMSQPSIISATSETNGGSIGIPTETKTKHENTSSLSELSSSSELEPQDNKMDPVTNDDCSQLVSIASTSSLSAKIRETNSGYIAIDTTSSDSADDAQGKADTLLELRGYQKDLAEKAKLGLNCLIVAPTGSGKTIVALEISKHHMETGDARKMLFLVNKVPLVSQQYEQYVKYLPNRFRCFMLHGDVEIKIPISKIVETNDVIIMTPQVLLNALDEGDLKSLSSFTLMIFDECHHATKDHPYNAIMSNHFHDGTKVWEQPKPQIIGLTASTGVGKAKSEKEAVDHILQLCANLNIFEICTVQGSESLEELNLCVSHPTEDSVKVKKRANDPFSAVISDIMQTIEQKMLNRPEIPQCIEKIPNFSCIQQPPSNRGSLQYVEYITKIKRPIASIYEQNVHRFFVVCRDYLEIYNRALQINSECRTIDALKFIQSEIAKIRSKPVNVFDETDNWLLDLFTTKETELKHISSDPLNENPKLKELQDQILSYYKDNKDSLGIVFCKTRDMVQSLCDWMKDTPELTWLNPNIAMGTGKSSNMKASSAMTKSKLEDVLEYFKGQKHKVLIATSVIEEGLDVAKCNYVIRYGHVTNDIARVQARGRARAMNASYVLVGEEEGGAFERDRNNQIREEMMHRAIERINMMPVDEKNEIILEKQQQAKIEKETKLIAEEVRNANKRRDKCDGEYEIKCLRCSAFGIYSTDLRTIKGNQHVVIDDTFWSRINTKPHPEPRTYDDFTKTHKISCKQCGMDWGIKATYKSLPCCVIKIQSFCVIHPDGKRIMYSRWKNVPFHIDEITTDELESMSNSLGNIV